jgi:hypothetical protein
VSTYRAVPMKVRIKGYYTLLSENIAAEPKYVHVLKYHLEDIQNGKVLG